MDWSLRGLSWGRVCRRPPTGPWPGPTRHGGQPVPRVTSHSPRAGPIGHPPTRGVSSPVLGPWTEEPEAPHGTGAGPVLAWGCARLVDGAAPPTLPAALFCLNLSGPDLVTCPPGPREYLRVASPQDLGPTPVAQAPWACTERVGPGPRGLGVLTRCRPSSRLEPPPCGHCPRSPLSFPAGRPLPGLWGTLGPRGASQPPSRSIHGAPVSASASSRPRRAVRPQPGQVRPGPEVPSVTFSPRLRLLEPRRGPSGRYAACHLLVPEKQNRPHEAATPCAPPPTPAPAPTLDRRSTL